MPVLLASGATSTYVRKCKCDCDWGCSTDIAIPEDEDEDDHTTPSQLRHQYTTALVPIQSPARLRSSHFTTFIPQTYTDPPSKGTFAEQTEGKSHIVIVGRNRAAAERILGALPKPSPSTTSPEHANAPSASYSREFVECDATLMQNVDRAAKEILSRHKKINYLVVSCGLSALGGRDETTEGIDKKLAVHYYARWKFIGDLLPALERATSDGKEATVMSVMAASYGGEIDVDDLGLKKTFSTTKAALVTPTYNDLMMESYASRSPSVTFVHAHPGFVRTNLMSSSTSPIMRAMSPVLLSPYSPIGLLMHTMSVSPIQSGEYMWKAIRETTKAHPGAWRTGAKGDDLGLKRYYGNESQREVLWKHTEEEMRRCL